MAGKYTLTGLPGSSLSTCHAVSTIGGDDSTSTPDPIDLEFPSYTTTTQAHGHFAISAAMADEARMEVAMKAIAYFRMRHILLAGAPCVSHEYTDLWSS